MRFRLQTDYALKALLFLARKGEANSTTEEIAEFYGISAAHLGRVIRRLQRYGFVKAIRGRRGGVRLNRDPQHLTLGEIVETLEEGGSLAEATEGEKLEAREQASRMRAILRRAQGLFTNYLSKASMSDLVSDLVGEPSTGEIASGTSSSPDSSNSRDGQHGSFSEPAAPQTGFSREPEASEQSPAYIGSNDLPADTEKTYLGDTEERPRIP